MLCVGGIAYVVIRQLMKPIDATVVALEDISQGEGDLTRRLDENQIGELGDLAKHFNRFASRICDVVQSIAGIGIETGWKRQTIVFNQTGIKRLSVAMLSLARRSAPG